MYLVNQTKKKFKKNKIDGYELINLDGFIMSSKKGLKIGNQIIRDVKVVDKDFAHILAYDKVIHIYNKLLDRLTELLTSDDDSGDSLREALNQIERFRLEIKNKYRSFLKKKELEKMSKQLLVLKKESERRLIEMNYNINELTSGKSR